LLVKRRKLFDLPVPPTKDMIKEAKLPKAKPAKPAKVLAATKSQVEFSSPMTKAKKLQALRSTQPIKIYPSRNKRSNSKMNQPTQPKQPRSGTQLSLRNDLKRFSSMDKFGQQAKQMESFDKSEICVQVQSANDRNIFEEVPQTIYSL
jgi:hypothetical protein